MYLQSDQQRQFYKTFGDFLLVNFHYDSCNLRKTLLSIFIIKDGVGCTICLITLPARILLNIVNHCFEIFAKVRFFPVPKKLMEFVSYCSIFFLQCNDTSRTSTVKVCRENLMPVINKNGGKQKSYICSGSKTEEFEWCARRDRAHVGEFQHFRNISYNCEPAGRSW